MGKNPFPRTRLYLCLTILAGLVIGGSCKDYRPNAEAAAKLPHHTAAGFKNLHLDTPRGRFLGFLRWRLGLGPRETPAFPPDEAPPYQPIMAKPDLNQLHHPDPHTIQVTWIGHSTFLVQVAGINLLTDPIFSDRASPVSFAGPKRRVPPGVAFEDLPPIHAVVVSHNHYDHLDYRTVTRLGNGTRFFAPLGLGRWFQKNGLTQVTELDWWDSAKLGPLRFQAVPAQHFSVRTMFDGNETLWCSWVVDSPAGRIYFTGDTGYSPDFKEIGARLGPMRLALIHIGGYRPRWFMKPMHLNPEEAVRVHQDVRSRQSIGMHWGTFKLTDEPLSEPPRFLSRVLRQNNIPEEQFLVMKIGETRVFR